MTFSHPLAGHPDAARLRREAGKYLKNLRIKADLTQRDIAVAMGFDYYTVVSQIERGLTRVPPDKMADWARLMGVDPRDFGKRLLRFYDPYMWNLLFGTQRSDGEQHNG